jgi:FSR family fosmidomycin resistance protein-like MFS transporter
MGTVGSLAGGPLADRHGYKRTVLFSLGLTTIFLNLFYHTKGTESLLLFAAAGLILSIPNAITMAMGQSFMPKNLGMASGLILGLAMGVGGIGTTILGWVADQWGLHLTLQITFILPLLGLVPFFFIPYPPHQEERVA